MVISTDRFYGNFHLLYLPLKPDYSILFIFITFYYNFFLFFRIKWQNILQYLFTGHKIVLLLYTLISNHLIFTVFHFFSKNIPFVVYLSEIVCLKNTIIINLFLKNYLTWIFLLLQNFFSDHLDEITLHPQIFSYKTKRTLHHRNFFTHLIFISLLTELLYCNTGESTYTCSIICTYCFYEY